jgi:hypothetical protein
MKLYQTTAGEVILADTSKSVLSGEIHLFPGTVVKSDNPQLIGRSFYYSEDDLDGEYSKPVILTNTKAPTFVISATNPLCQFIVEHYADEVEEFNGDADLAASIRNFAKRIEEWQMNNPVSNTP